FRKCWCVVTEFVADLPPMKESLLAFTTPPHPLCFTLSLHDALPISRRDALDGRDVWVVGAPLGDSTSAQFWVDADRWRLLRIIRSEEHTSELQSRGQLVCRLLLEKKKTLEPIKERMIVIILLLYFLR